jgi:hypothetical protein
MVIIDDNKSTKYSCGIIDISAMMADRKERNR